MTRKKENPELTKGIVRLKWVIKNKKDFYNAFEKPGFGVISLIYGKPGIAIDNFKGGNGIAHIIAKRNWEGKTNTKLKNQKGIDVAKKLIDVIVNGKIVKTIKTKQTVFIHKDGYEAILSLNWFGNKITWLFNGYKIL